MKKLVRDLILPDWLRGVYLIYGEPQVRPDPAEGVRFFDGNNWITRRMWMWNPKVDRIWINHRFYMDQYSDHWETVAESDDINKARVSLRTTSHPTDDQIFQVLRLANFLEVS